MVGSQCLQVNSPLPHLAGTRAGRYDPQKAMAKVALVHWNAEEWAERALRLARAGHVVPKVPVEKGTAGLRSLVVNPPDAIVIDLSRLPSHGQAVAIAFRQQRGTRQVPLVFVEGEPKKVAKVREQLPDAEYSRWRTIRSAVSAALRRRNMKPVVPGTMAGYSGTPLPKKLGIKAGSSVALLGAPRDFLNTLGHLPDEVSVHNHPRTPADVVILFVRSSGELRRKLPTGKRAMSPRGRLWMAWPKKASGVVTDVTERTIRETGLASGLVDFKIAAIDATWAGLCFAKRK